MCLAMLLYPTLRIDPFECKYGRGRTECSANSPCRSWITVAGRIFSYLHWHLCTYGIVTANALSIHTTVHVCHRTHLLPTVRSPRYIDETKSTYIHRMAKVRDTVTSSLSAYKRQFLLQ